MSQAVGQLDVLGRAGGADAGPVGELGRFLARDGSLGGRVAMDLDRPHVVSVVGKRGSGKSYTLGVLAEELADAEGVTGVVVDAMGVFRGLAAAGAWVVDEPAVRPGAIPAAEWPGVVGLDPVEPAGSLVWRAADVSGADVSGADVSGADVSGEGASVAEMRSWVSESGADPAAVRAADAHLALAESWDCFDPAGLAAADLLGESLTVLDCSRLSGATRIAVVGAVARVLYRAAVEESVPRLPWLLVDEAHACYAGPARGALDALVTRGRQPGVSLVLATQRPGGLPEVAISQTDLLVAHRLTAAADVAALSRAQPTYLAEDVAARLPTRPGDALVVDDTTESAATVRIRERRTPHGGESPRARRRNRND